MDKFLLMNSPLVLGLIIALGVLMLYARMESARQTVRDLFGGFKGLLGSTTGQIGGYVHDTAVVVVTACRDMMFPTGTWTDTVNPNATNSYMVRRTAGAATQIVVVPILPPQDASPLKGSLIKTITLEYEVTIAALTSLDVLIWKGTRAVNLSARANATAVAFAYDAAHNTAALRFALAKHLMVVTLTTPIWLADTDDLIAEITAVCPATSVLDIYPARTAITLRL